MTDLPYMDFLHKLNPEQREAVLHRDGPLLILAGAGSGKTRVITYRIAYLIGDGHAEPDQVLAVTFTNKAAGEMRERVEALIGDESKGVWLSTFHALCARLLRREAPKIGLTRDFVIYDSADQVALVKQIEKELDIDDKFVPPRQALSRISHLRNRMEGPDCPPRHLQHQGRADREDLRALCDIAPRQQRPRLRRPAAQDGRALRHVGAGARVLRAQVPLRHDRRVPGHEPAAIHADSVPGRSPPQPRRCRRSRSVDLQVARRRTQEHPRLRARLPGGGNRPAGAELSLHADHPRRRKCGHRAEHAIARTSGSGPTGRAVRASFPIVATTNSRKPTSSSGP